MLQQVERFSFVCSSHPSFFTPWKMTIEQRTASIHIVFVLVYGKSRSTVPYFCRGLENMAIDEYSDTRLVGTVGKSHEQPEKSGDVYCMSTQMVHTYTNRTGESSPNFLSSPKVSDCTFCSKTLQRRYRRRRAGCYQVLRCCGQLHITIIRASATGDTALQP